MGRLVSDLLAQSLAELKAPSADEAPQFQWVTKSMRARVDLAGKHALLDAMDDRRP